MINFRAIVSVHLVLSPWMVLGGFGAFWSNLTGGCIMPEQFDFLGGALTLTALICFVIWQRNVGEESVRASTKDTKVSAENDH